MDDGTGHSSGKLDRISPDSEDDWFHLRSQSSDSSCTVTNACGAPAHVDVERGRCEAGLGVTVVPTPYLGVPGIANMNMGLRAIPWEPVPAAFVLFEPSIRDVLGF